MILPVFIQASLIIMESGPYRTGLTYITKLSTEDFQKNLLLRITIYTGKQCLLL